MLKLRNRTDRPASGWSELRALARTHRRRLGSLSILAFLGALLEATFLVVLTGVAMALVDGADQVQVAPSLSVSYTTALGAAAFILLLRLLANVLEVRQSAGLAAEIVRDTRRDLSTAYIGTSWATQHSEPSGRLQEILTSFVERANWAAGSMALAVSSGLSLLAFLGTSLAVDPLYTVAVLAAVVGFGFALGPLRRRIRLLAAEMAKSNLEYANTVSELGSLGMEMQTFGVQQEFLDRIHLATEKNTDDRFRVTTAQLMTQPIYMFLAYGAIIFGVALLTRSASADLATFGAVLLLMLRSLSYGQNLQASIGALVAQVPFLRLIDGTIVRYRDQGAPSGAVVPTSALPLEFMDVAYAYAADRPALAGLNLRIEQGEALGVAGPSGSGKSTFAQLLLGLREPSTGKVRANGIDLREVDRAWWTMRVAMVPQEPHLITGTVAENIRFFRDGIDERALRRAASQANILDEILAMPDGFETHLGERGSQLSGGQKQRLSIARALVGAPELLMLDEPTSALDGRSESLIRATIQSLRGDVTVVIIAHRMSLLETCNRVLVIEDGRVTDLDTPAALRQSSRFYRSAHTVVG